ncbi:hypothetical protein MOUN0_H02872 [Monosporozyma unispora]|nr:hypothetical protein C6P44_004493 [Kazachstania unispora]
MTEYAADHEAPLNMLSVKDYFPALTTKEQKYAHFMSKASHAGTRIVLRQVSHESEAIFDLILSIHRAINGEYPTDDKDVTLYLDYVSQFLSNLGNYKSFGDSKFIPACSQVTWVKLMKSAGLNPSDKVVTKNCLYETYHDLLVNGIYYVDDKVAMLGFPADGYVSSYYLGDPISLEDMKLIKAEIFASLSILPENTRIKKSIKDSRFEIYVASVNLTNEITKQYPIEPVKLSNGFTVIFKFGDHSDSLKLVVKYLSLARANAANEIQSKMLTEYIEHFQSGSSQAHKESQKLWVKDLSPIVETNIGFIETYREPSGIIGEFESLVSIQNKERTAKFANMVSHAETYISMLPWNSDYEKPKFNPPDFTSLEVLTFTGSGIPAGINIPNYDDVRLTIGFKNVSLGNILSAAAKSSNKFPPSFISDEDRPVYEKYQGESFEVQVGIHELLGHGSGKLLMETEANKYNFDIEAPPLGLDGKPVTTYYKLGETWGSKFGALAGAFEETRAEVVAMFLITNRELLNIFGFKSREEQDNVIYAGYLQMARAGLLALEYWDPKTGKWGQPHMQARFSIMKTFLNHCPNDSFLTLEKDSQGELHLKLKKELIETAGHECVKDYLNHLHVYKCSADVERGTAYYVDRSTVTPELAQYRDLVISKRLPRRQFIQANTVLEGDEVELKEYSETPLGMIQSFIEREY